ncbi:MAG TPA: hypothetical protein VFA34_08420 [Actinomycetota bacterium]|jgi:hypothetical protein|nr:hypothetical protein [Actinomycetota bacterium]
MTSKALRFSAALTATVMTIMLVPFAIPGFGRIGGVNAFASGTVVHADLLQSGATKLVDAEVAFSGAAFDSGGLLKAVFNEMDRMFAPKLPTKLGFGRGAALEVGLGVAPDVKNQMILAGEAEASTRPNIAPVTTGAGPIDLDPLVWADLLRGQAAASAAEDGCALGRDASNGHAYVADAQLLDTGSSAQTQTKTAAPAPQPPAQEPTQQNTAAAEVSKLVGAVKQSTRQAATQPEARRPAAPAASAPAASASHPAAMPNAAGLEQPVVSIDADGPARAVSQSFSRTLFVAQRDREGRRLGNAFGVMSEVRQTIAPITLFKGTSNRLTIEVLGEWVLQVVAGGLPSTGYVHYGPEKASPDTPVVRLINSSGATRVLTLQDLVTDDGLVINIPNIAEIAIGEAPRAIDGAAGSRPTVARGGTLTAAAVDVVRVRALPGAPVQLTDVRVGHMEAKSQVPAGGVSCSIPVAKTPSKDKVNVGGAFDVTFNVTNPYDCTLTDVRVEDVITTERDARFTVLGTQPTATSPRGAALEGGTIRWANIGDIAPHASRVLKATIGARGGAGTLIDKATAAGTLDDCAQHGATIAGVDFNVVGMGITGTSAEVRIPETVRTAVLSRSNQRLPSTGAPILFLIAAGFVSMAVGAASLLQVRRLH